MGIHIIDQAEPYRLISNDSGRCAVVEARAGHVYSLQGRDHREALDTPEGMAEVVGDDGWRDEFQARVRFDAVVGQALR